MAVRIVRLGTPRHPDEGLRFGTVRHPPRGVRKSDYARQNWFDVWLPNLSPSAALRRKTDPLRNPSTWPAFERRFRSEMQRAEPRYLLDALAALSHVANFSIGCYCEDEQRCHRSVLRRELKKRGADIK